MTDTNSKEIIKAIKTFVNSLADEYSEKFHALRLYQHFLDLVSETEEFAIDKNIKIFKDFCEENISAIIEKDSEKFVGDGKISYSKKVYINLKSIFGVASDEDKAIIWKHLLYISALVNPTGKAREMLRRHTKDGGIESEFIESIIAKVEGAVKPTDNPMEAVSQIMQSGVFTELITEMNDSLESGELDIGKLLHSVKGMVGGMEGETESAEESDALGGINNLLSSITSNLEGSDGDISAALGPIFDQLGKDTSENPTMMNMMGMMNQMIGGMAAGGPGAAGPAGAPNPLSMLSKVMSEDSGGIAEKLDAEYTKMMKEKEKKFDPEAHLHCDGEHDGHEHGGHGHGGAGESKS